MGGLQLPNRTVYLVARRYNNCALTYVIIDRIFEQAGRRFRCQVPGRMGYEDFVWFLLSEEDKSTDTALAYWFR